MTWNPESPWEEHPDHSPSDWMYDVGSDHTRLGYVDWVNAKLGNELPSSRDKAFVKEFRLEFERVMPSEKPLNAEQIFASIRRLWRLLP